MSADFESSPYLQLLQMTAATADTSAGHTAAALLQIATNTFTNLFFQFFTFNLN